VIQSVPPAKGSHPQTSKQAIPSALPVQEELDKPDIISSLDDAQKESLINEMIAGMSLDEEIGQLFILAVRHTDNGKPALSVDERVKTFMDDYKPGGIILFSINFQTPDQTIKLINDLQAISRYPLFITTDEEGGKVSRLGRLPRMDVVSLPPAAELGKRKTPALTEKSTEVLGLDLRELGFNMNMAPVADVVVPGEPNPIGNRSFSSNPEDAGSMTAAAVKGFLKAGISPVLKHFPGHGNVGGDSHLGAVTSRSSRSEFYKRDFIPFLMGMDAGCNFIMIGHISAPALTDKQEPASLSYDIQTRILRQELGYKGLIITDAMDMGAITNNYNPGIASLKAFHAGTDLILMPENIPAAQKSFKDAIASGTLSRERLEDSVRRILKVKMDNRLFDEKNGSSLEYNTKVRNERHTRLLNLLNSQKNQ